MNSLEAKKEDLVKHHNPSAQYEDYTDDAMMLEEDEEGDIFEDEEDGSDMLENIVESLSELQAMLAEQLAVTSDLLDLQKANAQRDEQFQQTLLNYINQQGGKQVNS